MKFKAINTLSIKELFISQIEEMILGRTEAWGQASY